MQTIVYKNLKGTGSQPFINEILLKIPNFNLKDYLHRIYQEKTPVNIARYFKPEMDYLENLAEEINPYLNDIKKNLVNQFKKDPKNAMKTSLENLLFPSGEFKEEFQKKIENTIEEISYAIEIGALEGYKIWNIKSNLPIIGNIYKKKIKQYFGKEDLPSFDYIKDRIKEFKSDAYDFFHYIDLYSCGNFSKEEIREQYYERMKNLGYNNRIILEKDYNEKRYFPLNSEGNEKKFREEIKEEYFKSEKISEKNNFEGYYMHRKKERQNRFIRSEYNSFGEKLICYIGRFFNWLFRE